VDTSALIAILDEDDIRHEEASATFRSLVDTADLVTHNYIHVEAVAVATRRLGTAAAQRLIDSLLPVIDTIWIDEPLHRAALAAHRSGGASVSLVDQVSFVLMRQNAIQTAFAFDADYELQGFSRPPGSPTMGEGSRVSEARSGYGPLSPEQPDLVSVAEIADRAGRPVNTVQSWRRRHADFPTPVARLAAGPIWSWAAVAAWICARPPSRVTNAA
jgi:predicted nucleic acid-binding protein